jgi:hypothetical protein
MNQTHPSLKPRRRLFSRALPISIGGLLAATALTSFGEDTRMDKLESENAALKARLDSLEALAKKEGIVPSGDAPKSLSALSESTISGFVTASYFYNTSAPADRRSNGYLWNTRDNQFSINKVKITLASPAVERSGDKWDAGYRTSLIFGEDAWAVNTGSGQGQPGFDELREAFVELNAPIGSGLNIKAGQLISLLNYESGDGGAANNNFSQGYQWYYTGNGPSAGVQLGYTFTDWFSSNVRVQNGMFAGPTDGNDAKTVIASFNFKPTEKVWFNVIGFGGSESPTLDLWGASIIGGVQVTKEFNAGFEFDYFNIDLGTKFDVWSIGTFLSYDLTSKFGIGLRAEYLNDESTWIPGTPFLSPASQLTTTDTSGDLASVALTLNYKPVPNVKIQPEIRYDTTGFNNAFDGHDSRVILGIGISYLF